MVKKSTFNMTCIGDIVAKIVLLPNVSKKLNINLTSNESVNLEVVDNLLLRNSQNGPDHI